MGWATSKLTTMPISALGYNPVMRFFVLLSALFLAACGPLRQVEFEVVNASAVPLFFTVGVCVFAQTVSLAPGGRWVGTLDPRLAPKRLPVVIRTQP